MRLHYGLVAIFTLVSRVITAPVWQDDLSSTRFSESTEIGDNIGTLVAEDSSNQPFTYSIEDLDDDDFDDDERDAFDYFNVDPDSGNVTLKLLVDYEIFKQINAVWRAGSVRSDQVRLYIVNENDNDPVFQGEPYSADVDEDTAIDVPIFRATATDADGDSMTYSLGNGGGCEETAFAVDPQSGDVLVNKILDYASVVQYLVCIKVEDPVGQFDETQLVISIKDVQNLPPVFEGQPYDTEISEDVPVNDVVFTVAARDGDRGVTPQNQIRYSLPESANDTFGIGGTTGEIMVLRELDRDTDPITQFYTLTVQAKEEDLSQPANQTESTTNVYIRLLDVDDNIPEFNQEGPVSTTIPENSPKGTQLDFGLEAFDLDANEAGEIELVLEGDGGVFWLANEVILNSGVVDIRVENSSALDFETIQDIIFTIRAESVTNSSRFSRIDARVNLTNINDNTPVFSQELYNVSLPENSPPGTSVVQILATDKDSDAVLSYDLLGYNDNWFNVNGSTGDVTVSEIAAFDAERLSVYFLTCQVTDSERVSTALLSVAVTDVNDEEPVFQNDQYQVSIPEYTASDLEDMNPEERIILQVTATDADMDPINKLLTYSILSGNEKGKFEINETTGIIYRKMSIDIEQGEDVYHLVVMAMDDGEPRLNGTAEVQIDIEDVNDNKPVFTSAIYYGSVAENATSGEWVLNVSATDSDVTNSGLIYTIDGANMFLVTPVGDILLNGQLDYETVTLFNFSVIATDREAPFGTATSFVVIDVLDVNDVPPEFITSSPLSIKVDEDLTEVCGGEADEENCTTLVMLQASDADTDPALLFSILEVQGYDENNRQVERNLTSQFGVEEETGAFYVQETLDREMVQRFEVTVQVQDVNAVDGPEQTDTAELVITVADVNDNPPEFTDDLPANFTIAETNQLGMVISVNVRATDSDAGDNGTVIYEMVDSADGMVQIDEDTGILSVAAPIDRERNATLLITFCAKDLGSPRLNTTVTRQIFIEDVNDNTPKFNQTLPQKASLFENTVIGTFVMQVWATDADEIYGEVTYSISSDIFAIGNKSGEIVVAKEIDREQQSSYVLTVVASDGTRQDNLEVTIDILDVNDLPPVFNDESFPTRVSISETAEPGSAVAVVLALDGDQPNTNNSAVRYTLRDLNGTDFFKIDEMTGVISLNTSTTDTLIPGLHVLEVQAYDLGTPRLESEPRTFKVVVTDYNDDAPRFTNPEEGDVLEVQEDYIGYIVTAEAEDEDLGDNGIVTFEFDTSLGQTDDHKFFSIDPDTGVINITTMTDRETQARYILTVRGLNAKSDPMRSSDVTFSIEVQDKDDNEPAYWGPDTGSDDRLTPPDPAILQVQENLGEGSFVGTVPTAVDLDSELFNQIYYFIVDGDQEGYFLLNKESGNLTLLKPVDREEISSFDLIIMANSDPDFSPEALAATDVYDPLEDERLARVVVEVTDENDSPPEFEKNMYSTGLLYTTKFGEVLITVKASDPDTGTAAVVVYSITNQSSYGQDAVQNSDDVSIVSINSQTGAVINNVNPGLSEDSFYLVQIQATDAESDALYDTANLTIYMVQDLDEVSVIFSDEPDNVRRIQDDFASLLEEIVESEGTYTDVAINIDSIDYEYDSADNAIPNKTEMLLHVVNIPSNTVIEPSEIQRILDAALEYMDELDAYHVESVDYLVRTAERDVLDSLQKFSFSLAAVMLLLLLLILLLYYSSVSTYRRKLRAATAGLYENDFKAKNDAPAPGTNQYANEKNPVFDNPTYAAKAEQGQEPHIDIAIGEEEKKSESGPGYEEIQEEVMEFAAEPDLSEEEEEHHYESPRGDNTLLLDQMLARYETKTGLPRELADTLGESDIYVSDV